MGKEMIITEAMITAHIEFMDKHDDFLTHPEVPWEGVLYGGEPEDWHRRLVRKCLETVLEAQ